MSKLSRDGLWFPSNEWHAGAASKPSFSVEARGDSAAVLHCGNCLDMMSEMASDRYQVDMIFADPPFNAGKVYASGQHDDNMPKEQYLNWLEAVFSGVYALLKPGGTLWVMNDTRWIGYCQIMLDDVGPKGDGFTFLNMISWPYANPIPSKDRFPKSWRPILLYCKGDKPVHFDPNAMPLGGSGTIYFNPARATTKFAHDVWADIPKLVGGYLAPPELLTTDSGEFAHLAQMPEAIAMRAILSATLEGAVVLDPFMGSGTVGAACLRSGRKFVGIDIESEYVHLAHQRLEDLAAMLAGHRPPNRSLVSLEELPLFAPGISGGP